MSIVSRYLDQALLHPPMQDMRRRDYIYASALGFMSPEGKISANCRRSEFYRMLNFPSEETLTPQGARRMLYGSAIEEAEVELAKQARIYVGAQKAVIDDEHKVSGKIDLVVIDPTASTDPYVGVEIKSTSGWSAPGLTTPNNRGLFKPKINHLAQMSFYAWCYRGTIKNWVLRYVDRGTGDTHDHPVVIMEDGSISVNGAQSGFSIHHLLAWADSVVHHLRAREEPPRDFRLLYTKEQLKAQAEAGELAKTYAEKALKGHRMYRGDWNCKFCRHLRRCQEGVELPYGLSLDEAVSKLTRK